MDRYNVVLTAARTVTGDDGVATQQPKGTVVNVILWDGVTPYDPGEGLALVKAA